MSRRLVVHIHFRAPNLLIVTAPAIATGWLGTTVKYEKALVAPLYFNLLKLPYSCYSDILSVTLTTQFYHLSPLYVRTEILQWPDLANFLTQ